MKCFTIDNRLTKCDDFDIRYIEYGCDEEEHTHDGIEITYVVAGHGEHIVNGKPIKVGRGSLLITGYNCVHCIHTWETIRYYNILFKASFLSDSLNKRTALDELFKCYYDYNLQDDFLYVEYKDEEFVRKLESMIYDILYEAINKESRYVGFMRCRLDEFFNTVLRNISKTGNVYSNPMLAEVINYINQNSDTNLKIDDVAEKFNYNSKYLSNKLKEYCGLSFKQLLIQKRLNKVIEELWRSDAPIEEVIERFGFTNKTYFYKLFLENYGVKPKFIREYRRNYDKYLELKAKHKDMLN